MTTTSKSATGAELIKEILASKEPITVRAPRGKDFICFEPMTAPTNALVRGGPALPLVRPGGEHAACFSITVQPT